MSKKQNSSSNVGARVCAPEVLESVRATIAAHKRTVTECCDRVLSLLDEIDRHEAGGPLPPTVKRWLELRPLTSDKGPGPEDLKASIEMDQLIELDDELSESALCATLNAYVTPSSPAMDRWITLLEGADPSRPVLAVGRAAASEDTHPALRTYLARVDSSYAEWELQALMGLTWDKRRAFTPKIVGELRGALSTAKTKIETVKGGAAA